jgi:hypothetical protein
MNLNAKEIGDRPIDSATLLPSGKNGGEPSCYEMKELHVTQLYPK